MIKNYSLTNKKFYATWSKMPKHIRESQYILPKSKVIKLWPNTLKKIIPNNTCKAITLYGSFQGNTLGVRLTQWVLNNIFLTQIQKEIIIGIMLGDGHIRKAAIRGNPYIILNQGLLHLDYILFLYLFLSPICTRFPLLVQRRDGSFYLQMNTRCLSCLNSIYDIFIKNGVKTIPKNIGGILTPRALAFWSMDDGSKAGSGFYLNTHSYTLSENILLQKALKSKFKLDVNIHKHKNQYKLYIVAKDMNVFKSIVSPYFASSFLYKLA
jgi:hypothetical protein